MSLRPRLAPGLPAAVLAALGLHAALGLWWLEAGAPRSSPGTHSAPSSPKANSSMQTRQQSAPAPLQPPSVDPDMRPAAAKPTTEPTAKPAAPQPSPARPMSLAGATPIPAPSSAPASGLSAQETPDSARRYLAAPSLHWQYRLQQDEQEGWARLHWQSAETEGRYQARLQRELAGRPLPAWRSEGGFDALGLAPIRFAEQRRAQQDSRALNFRREQGLISFSASPEQIPLPAGAQDRLSWMLQLAALLEGDSRLRQTGRRIQLPVAGVRGSLADWEFEVLGRQDLSLPVGTITGALHLRRAAPGLYEPDVEVWLDPARHHLPVRLRHSQGDRLRWTLELQTEALQGATPP